jgi:hypothetical protein
MTNCVLIIFPSEMGRWDVDSFKNRYKMSYFRLFMSIFDSNVHPSSYFRPFMDRFYRLRALNDPKGGRQNQKSIKTIIF